VTLRVGVTLLVLAAVSAASAWSATSSPRTFVLDSVILQAGQSGPDGLKPGHVESATGLTKDVAGRTVGRFSSTCVVLKALAKGDALIRCSGSGISADGRLSFAGTVHASNPTPTLPITGGTGADRGSRGTITEYPLTQKETLVEIALTVGKGRVGVVARPAANAAFPSRIVSDPASSREKRWARPRSGAQSGSSAGFAAVSHRACASSSSPRWRFSSRSNAATNSVSRPSRRACSGVGAWMYGGELPYFTARPFSGMLLK